MTLTLPARSTGRLPGQPMAIMEYLWNNGARLFSGKKLKVSQTNCLEFPGLAGFKSMNILGYGEDALTLWALKNRMPEILAGVMDSSPVDQCSVLFRPSFGRSGGPNSSQFGEFDFILSTPRAVHLGETKWQNSPEVAEPTIRLRPEQLERHLVFSIYYKTWISKPQWAWKEFLRKSSEEFRMVGINKPIPPVDSLLSKNLMSILTILAQSTNRSPEINNLLLIVDCKGSLDRKDCSKRVFVGDH